MTLVTIILSLLVSPAAAIHSSSFAPKNYLVYYGKWTPVEIEKAEPFELIVLHPGEAMDNITPSLIKQLKRGGKTKVIAYVSIGETQNVPLGPEKAGETGYPSWFLDADKDGLPDENGRWGSYFVRAGDSAWKKNRLARMRELKRRFDVDGFFLDTLDTASPWGKYGWMQGEMARLVWDIGSAFPDSYILANRGLFLLKSYPKLFRPAIDGLMFESFISEWDWHRKIGIPHPWLRSNTDTLKESILSQAAKKDGFHLYLLNYADPTQSDFYNLDADLHTAMKGVKWTNYYSTPELNRVEPPPSTCYKKSAALPGIKKFTVEEIEKGDFTATILLANTQDLALGSDYFLDLRYAGERIREDELLHAKRIPIDSDILTLEDVDGGREARIQWFGLQRLEQYFFYLRVRGRDPTAPAPLFQKSLVTKGGSWPDTVKDVKLKAGHESVALSWEAPHTGIAEYNIYIGAHPAKPTLVKSVKKTSAKIKNLRNGGVYFFSVAAVGKDKQVGGLSEPRLMKPEASKGQLPPAIGTIKSKGTSISMSWSPPENPEKISGYRIYCSVKNGKPRLPLKVSADQRTYTIKGLRKKTVYSVYMTSVDLDALESAPSKRWIMNTR